jgi:hypothetical protein
MLKDVFTRERKLFLNRIGKSTPSRPTRDDVFAGLIFVLTIGVLLFGFKAFI